MIAVVDSEDFERLNRYNWCAEWRRKTKSFYAVRRGPAGDIYMAPEILRLPRGGRQHADHINHDTLDNRKCNLRKCTPGQNSYNVRPTGSSGFKGVTLQDGRWRAHIFPAAGKHVSLGCYGSAEEAARAYDRAARKLRGRFAFLNFPSDK